MPKDSEKLDLYDEHEEIVSVRGKRVKRRGIFLLPNLLTTASLFSGFYSIISAIQGDFIADLEVQFKRDERVMRWLTVRLDKYSIAYAERRRKRLNANKTEKEEATS